MCCSLACETVSGKMIFLVLGAGKIYVYLLCHEINSHQPSWSIAAVSLLNTDSSDMRDCIGAVIDILLCFAFGDEVERRLANCPLLSNYRINYRMRRFPGNVLKDGD
jgi:hypothetical protein